MFAQAHLAATAPVSSERSDLQEKGLILARDLRSNSLRLEVRATGARGGGPPSIHSQRKRGMNTLELSLLSWSYTVQDSLLRNDLTSNLEGSPHTK